MSPVIILGLLLMWAVVLVPMWLRRHDEVEETRSVDRFTAAMHTLSRYDDRQREEMTAHRSRALDVHVSGASAPDAIAARRRRGMAQRRARSLAVLLVSGFVVLIGAAVTGNVLLWTLQVGLDLAVAAFLLHLRRMAILAANARRRAARQLRDRRELDDALAEPHGQESVTVRRAGSAVEPVERVEVRAAAAEPARADEVFDQTALGDHEVRVPASAMAAEPMAPRVAANDGFFDQETDLDAAVSPEPSFVAAGAKRATRVAAAPDELPAAEAVGGRPWEPVPVPRPTYSMKPAAPPRPTRRRASEPILPPVEPAVELEADDDLEAILDRRWAVND